MLHLRGSSSAIAIVGGLAFLGAAASAQASIITFDFGSLANGASNSQIQTFMNSLLPAGTSVTVTGAVASNNYNGDGHVTGPGGTSYTLAQLELGQPRYVYTKRYRTLIQRNQNGIQWVDDFEHQFRF